MLTSRSQIFEDREKNELPVISWRLGVGGGVRGGCVCCEYTCIVKNIPRRPTIMYGILCESSRIMWKLTFYKGWPHNTFWFSWCSVCICPLTFFTSHKYEERGRNLHSLFSLSYSSFFLIDFKLPPLFLDIHQHQWPPFFHRLVPNIF